MPDELCLGLGVEGSDAAALGGGDGVGGLGPAALDGRVGGVGRGGRVGVGGGGGAGAEEELVLGRRVGAVVVLDWNTRMLITV